MIDKKVTGDIKQRKTNVSPSSDVGMSSITESEENFLARNSKKKCAASANSTSDAFDCTDETARHFDRLAERTHKRSVREYYDGQANLLRSVRDDRQFVKQLAGLGAKRPTAADAFLLAAEDAAALNRRRTRALIVASLCVNVTLTGVKCAAALLSGSLAIISSLIDSALDLVSGMVTWYTEREIRKRDPYLYPRGCTRMEPLGSVIVSVIMGVANIQIISKSVEAMIADRQHMRVLSGRAAKPEFYCRILHVALDHLPEFVLEIETLKVYHMGTQFLVELHIVLDRNMPVHQAHDISELLQRKIEHLPYVERAFVHVDHDTTHSPEQEHKDV